MAHSRISDEINAGTLKDSSWVLLNVIQFQQIDSISSIEEYVIRCKYHICPFKRGIPQPVFPEMFARKLFSCKLTILLITCYLLPNWFRNFHQLLYGRFRTCFSMYLLRKKVFFEI